MKEITKKCACFIFEQPIQTNIKKVMLLDYFVQWGYEILLIDMSAVVSKCAYKEITNDLLDDSLYPVERCSSRAEFKRLIERLPKCSLVFIRIRWDIKTLFIFRLLEKRGLSYGYMTLNEYPDFMGKSEKKSSYFQRLSINKIVHSLFVRIPRKCLLKNGAAFVVVNCKERVKLYRGKAATKNTLVYISPSDVYIEAMQIKEEKRIIPEKYCVWLDIYYPYHIDSLETNIHVDPEKYYKELRDFFFDIERIYKIKVVIAAHPKSDYITHKDAYAGYKVIKMNTCLLCRDAEFVITTDSMSTMYGILYRKPILFIYQDSIIREGNQADVAISKWLANQLGVEAINICENYDEKFLNDKMNISSSVFDQKIHDWINRNDIKLDSAEDKLEGLKTFFERIVQRDKE